ncbi:antirestriction protein ArdC [Sphingomonas sp. SORGH_AS 950]|uniref:ArdC family protein n=1 Tax=Sphingomonas sp. SORGH_AS_0950 TaxID=3041792 RepID=UPI00278AD968|nr:zincin-like metallopeptidase domain-containing protein [Sphingomonas sp. SORGH_AS_0950]MDQ1158911.1 antirestriction protein ArdC [Sphingomonas sp. SORGH_AS_0950]
MTKETARRARGGDPSRPRDIYAETTAKIIAELEAGRFPWVQPWNANACHGPAPALPMNALTHRHYSGINVLYLWGAAITGGYASQHWLTFKQALEAGGNVRKGEKGTTVVYADRFVPEAEKTRAAQTGEDARAVPFLKTYTVFAVEQCEGLRPGLVVEPVALPEREIVPHAEALIAATGADFRIGGSEAFYAPGPDFIRVPPQPAFRDQINYYRTCFHELGHWTGHAKRLDRKLTTGRGGKDYAREELVAEMTTAFVCASLGIVPTVRHADYIGGWLGVLREDNRAIFRAASQASKAADYILAFDPREADADAQAERIAA